MDWRSLLGLPKGMSEKEFLEMELNKIKITKNRILIYGYDDKFFKDENYISAISKAIEKNIEVGMIIHERAPPTELDALVNKFDMNVKIYRSNNRFLINEGFRAMDNNFGVYYNKTKKSKYQPEKNLAFYRDYYDGINNIFLIRTYEDELKHLLNR